MVVSNIGDMGKVLATVAKTIYDFTGYHGNQWIYATGSNKARTMIYQRKLRQRLEEIIMDFDIYGLNNQRWEEFSKEKDYDAFLIKKK